jgi:hypothetical protein
MPYIIYQGPCVGRLRVILLVLPAGQPISEHTNMQGLGNSIGEMAE